MPRLELLQIAVGRLSASDERARVFAGRLEPEIAPALHKHRVTPARLHQDGTEGEAG